MYTVTVKPLCDEHISGIAEIEKACFAVPWSKKSIEESFANGTVFIGAFINNTLVGYCGLMTACDEGYITNIATLPQYRKRGVAKAVLSKIIEYSKENSLSFISLEVRASNKAAINLYTDFGFENMGIRKNFYRLPNEDAYIMTRDM